MPSTEYRVTSNEYQVPSTENQVQSTEHQVPKGEPKSLMPTELIGVVASGGTNQGGRMSENQNGDQAGPGKTQKSEGGFSRIGAVEQEIDSLFGAGVATHRATPSQPMMSGPPLAEAVRKQDASPILLPARVANRGSPAEGDEVGQDLSTAT